MVIRPVPTTFLPPSYHLPTTFLPPVSTPLNRHGQKRKAEEVSELDLSGCYGAGSRPRMMMMTQNGSPSKASHNNNITYHHHHESISNNNNNNNNNGSNSSNHNSHFSSGHIGGLWGHGQLQQQPALVYPQCEEQV